MDLKPGDYVKFLNDVGGGKITKIIDKHTALVLTDDGFEFPHLIKELIKIDEEPQNTDYQSVAETEKTGNSDLIPDPAEPVFYKDNENLNVYLAVVPDDQKYPSDGNYDIFIINDSNWHLMCLVSFKSGDNYETVPAIILPNIMEVVKTLNFDQLKDISEINIQILFFRKEKYRLHKPVFKFVKIRAEKFIDIKSFSQNEFFDEKAKIFPIIEEDPLKEAIQKLDSQQINEIVYEKEKKNKKINKKPDYRSSKVADTVEIDLHITELLDDLTGLTPADMLEFQLKVYREELEKALKNPHIKKIVFIHGKGNGTLRNEIRKDLNRRNIKFQDASIQKYGFGATLAYVSKKI